MEASAQLNNLTEVGLRPLGPKPVPPPRLHTLGQLQAFRGYPPLPSVPGRGSQPPASQPRRPSPGTNGQPTATQPRLPPPGPTGQPTVTQPRPPGTQGQITTPQLRPPLPKPPGGPVIRPPKSNFPQVRKWTNKHDPDPDPTDRRDQSQRPLPYIKVFKQAS